MTDWSAWLDLFWLEAASSIRFWECCAVLLALAVALLLPGKLERLCKPFESLFRKLAGRPLLSLLLIAAAPILLRLAVHPLLGTPQPSIHDEYSYLLAGDTFLHGRVTNPPDPDWKFFETFHTLQQPTYASMYPPAQGLFLAAGTLLTGRPWAGVLLSMGLLCAALLWMLRGWLPPQWALLGASLAVLRLGLFSYWMNSYWGGAPGAIGGALVAGSLPRIFRRQNAPDAVLFGLGLILLAASRPLEGFLYSLPFGVALLVWLLRDSDLRGKRFRQLLPLGVVLLAGAGSLAYYNWRVTGNALETPQMLNIRLYSAQGLTQWSKDPPPHHYNNDTMRTFYVNRSLDFVDTPQSLLDVLKSFFTKAQVVVYFFLGPLLAVPLILAPTALWSRKLALPLLGALTLLVGHLCVALIIRPHYFGPAACSLYAVVVLAMSRVWEWKWRDRPSGRFLVRGIVAVVVAMVGVRMSAGPLELELQSEFLDWSASMPGDYDRAVLLAGLRGSAGKFLVVVRYDSGHNTDREWVFNEADLSQAKVIWARDLGPETDALVRRFPDRQAVIVEPDRNPRVTTPYRFNSGLP